jgi:hypothetical protein
MRLPFEFSDKGETGGANLRNNSGNRRRAAGDRVMVKNTTEFALRKWWRGIPRGGLEPRLGGTNC